MHTILMLALIAVLGIAGLFIAGAIMHVIDKFTR